MIQTARALAGLWRDRRGASFLELVSAAAVLAGIFIVASATFERELHSIVGSVRAAIFGLLR